MALCWSGGFLQRGGLIAEAFVLTEMIPTYPAISNESAFHCERKAIKCLSVSRGAACSQHQGQPACCPLWRNPPLHHSELRDPTRLKNSKLKSTLSATNGGKVRPSETN